MNDAIINCLNEDEIHYQDLILIQRDSEGGIQALQTNMREVNRLKSQIVSEGNQSLLKLKEQSIGVPLASYASRCMLGETLEQIGFTEEVHVPSEP